MSNVSLVAENFKEKFYTGLKLGLEKVGEIAGHAVKMVQTIPQQMQDKNYVAVAVITSTNNIFLLMMHKIARRIEERLENSSLHAQVKRVFVPLFVNGAIGALMFGFNDFVLPKATKYPLSQSFKIAISITAIVLRIAFKEITTKTIIQTFPLINPDHLQSNPQPLKTPTQEKNPEIDPASTETVSTSNPKEKSEKQKKDLIEELSKVIKATKRIREWVQRKKLAKAAKAAASAEVPAAPPEAPPEAPPMGNRSFEKEPKELDLSQFSVEELSIADLNFQIKQLTGTIGALKLVLNDIEKIVKQEKILAQDCADLLVQQLEAERNVKRFTSILSNVQEDTPVSYVEFEVKKGLFKLMPIFSKERYNSINQKLKEKGLSDRVNPKYLKTNYPIGIQNKIKQATLTQNTCKTMILTKRNELDELRRSNNNGIPFADFSSVLAEKERLIRRYEETIRKHQQQIKKLEKPIPTEAPKKSDKMTIQEFVETSPELELEAWLALHTDYDASILLGAKTGNLEAYREKLFPVRSSSITA